MGILFDDEVIGWVFVLLLKNYGTYTLVRSLKKLIKVEKPKTQINLVTIPWKVLSTILN